MKVIEAKLFARVWVESKLSFLPGQVGAHLVGGITAMADQADFPSTKDVDIHLIFDEESPALRPIGPFAELLEESFGGILIEAGKKSIAEYRDAATVLANPEIAYHLTVDSILFDPSGRLAELANEVKSGYAEEEWVYARLDHERRGGQGALALRAPMSQMLGPSGEASILGYSTTFLAGALTVAALHAPRIGGRAIVVVREYLARRNRLDLHERLLDAVGLQRISREEAQMYLDEAAPMFDLAVARRQTPHPFQQKMHAHLRPYFVDSSQRMIDEGYAREAMGWIAAFYLAATDILIVDGEERERQMYQERQLGLLRRLGMATELERDERYAAAAGVANDIFALCEAMIESNPSVERKRVAVAA